MWVEGSIVSRRTRYAALLPLFIFIYGGAVLVLLSSAYELLSRKYDHIASNDAADDYLNRGLRDFLFPWKG